MTTTGLLADLEHYYDTAPRARCDTEEHGPLTLFVARSGFPYYARPRLGLAEQVTTADVKAVLERQRELDVAHAVEWVNDTTPSLLAAAREAGMTVEECPLLALERDPPEPDPAANVRIVAADDPQLALVRAAVDVGFGTAGTMIGTASVAERDEDAVARPEGAERIADLMRAGLSVLAGAFDPEAGPVGGGSHNPRGEVSEIVGVGVLPAYRRRGLAAAITARLARHALDHGVRTVFCSAQDDAVARVYESVGFRRVGTACVAEAG
ncbi:MAG TPA: GNAT family N-acetyltransferase [Mycobacteriales bacterium]|nr:GNAT family N-acetyltransferase [Mycobacteriales bacterium]